MGIHSSLSRFGIEWHSTQVTGVSFSELQRDWGVWHGGAQHPCGLADKDDTSKSGCESDPEGGSMAVCCSGRLCLSGMCGQILCSWILTACRQGSSSCLPSCFQSGWALKTIVKKKREREGLKWLCRLCEGGTLCHSIAVTEEDCDMWPCSAGSNKEASRVLGHWSIRVIFMA